MLRLSEVGSTCELQALNCPSQIEQSSRMVHSRSIVTTLLVLGPLAPLASLASLSDGSLGREMIGARLASTYLPTIKSVSAILLKHYHSDIYTCIYTSSGPSQFLLAVQSINKSINKSINQSSRLCGDGFPHHAEGTDSPHLVYKLLIESVCYERRRFTLPSLMSSKSKRYSRQKTDPRHVHRRPL